MHVLDHNIEQMRISKNSQRLLCFVGGQLGRGEMTVILLGDLRGNKGGCQQEVV